MDKKKEPKSAFPAQSQEKQPGIESKMSPRPKSANLNYVGSGKLKGKVAIITGGDSGIGRAVAIHYAKEGADLSIIYYDEDSDAFETQRLIEKEGGRCLLISGDLAKENFCEKAVEKTVEEFKRLDILVNNAAVQFPQESILDITSKQLERTFQVNIFSYFYMVKAALKYLKKGGVIINTASVTAYRGSQHLLDYSATKGAIVSFTRSLSLALVNKKIRVNGVAPGPIWTPLIPATFDSKKVETFGSKVPMQRAGQPEEIAPSYVFLACDDSSYFSGQILHPNGGEVINT